MGYIKRVSPFKRDTVVGDTAVGDTAVVKADGVNKYNVVAKRVSPFKRDTVKPVVDVVDVVKEVTKKENVMSIDVEVKRDVEPKRTKAVSDGGVSKDKSVHVTYRKLLHKTSIVLPFVHTDKRVILAVDGSFKDGVVRYAYVLYNVQGNVILEKVGITRGTEGNQTRGEVAAVIMGLRKAVELGYTSCVLIYDYSGIEDWVSGYWGAKQEFSQTYRTEFAKLNTLISVKFVWVKSHQSKSSDDFCIKCNNYVDSLFSK